MVNSCYHNTKKDSEKKHVKDVKIFLKKKRKKASVVSHKQNLPEYKRNYHLTHKK